MISEKLRSILHDFKISWVFLICSFSLIAMVKYLPMRYVTSTQELPFFNFGMGYEIYWDLISIKGGKLYFPQTNFVVTIWLITLYLLPIKYKFENHNPRYLMFMIKAFALSLFAIEPFTSLLYYDPNGKYLTDWYTGYTGYFWILWIVNTIVLLMLIIDQYMIQNSYVSYHSSSKIKNHELNTSINQLSFLERGYMNWVLYLVIYLILIHFFYSDFLLNINYERGYQTAGLIQFLIYIDLLLVVTFFSVKYFPKRLLNYHSLSTIYFASTYFCCVLSIYGIEIMDLVSGRYFLQNLVLVAIMQIITFAGIFYRIEKSKA